MYRSPQLKSEFENCMLNSILEFCTISLLNPIRLISLFELEVWPSPPNYAKFNSRSGLLNVSAITAVPNDTESMIGRT